MKTTSPAVQKQFDALVASLQKQFLVVEPSQMFGKQCVKAYGKGCIALFGDAAVFKLTGTAHAQAMKLSGAQLWDPSGKKRPMKEWVVVPAQHAKKWRGFAVSAIEYIASQQK